ncbi:Carboxypeptidase SOL1-like protein [Drosera capensis]
MGLRFSPSPFISSSTSSPSLPSSPSPLPEAANGAPALPFPVGIWLKRVHLCQHLGNGYMTNDELENAVISFSERCSNISRIYSIGNSVNGFPLWVLEISDNPSIEEPEPAFKATQIVEKVHLHMLASMNPDGFSLKRRGNANNVDLNRDFPDQIQRQLTQDWPGEVGTTSHVPFAHRACISSSIAAFHPKFASPSLT